MLAKQNFNLLYPYSTIMFPAYEYWAPEYDDDNDEGTTGPPASSDLQNIVLSINGKFINLLFKICIPFRQI